MKCSTSRSRASVLRCSAHRARQSALFSVLAACAFGLFQSGHARAHDRFAVEAFEPAPAVEGSLLNVYGARTLSRRAYTFSLVGSYARRPLSIKSVSSDKSLGDLVGSIGTLTLLGAVGIWDHLDLGFALPIHRVSRGSDFSGAPAAVDAARVDSTQIALGDLRLVPRISFLTRSTDHGVGLALLTQVYLPTGKDSAYAGEALRIEPRLAFDWRSKSGLLLAMNAGYLVRPTARVLDARVDDMVRAGLGADVPLALGLSALAEVDTQVNIFSDRFGRDDAPTEGLLALRFRKAGWLGQLGGGTGLERGLTAPRYRVFASITFTGLVEPDSDSDGLLDKVDACPSHPEDEDGFQDADGCPDLDDDTDGMPDSRDACARDPEDQDGFQDDDGCPDPDDDADAIADTTDRCPREPEDKDGFEDGDGCPELDNDQDGVADGEDRCPDQPGVPARAGCPAPALPQVVITEQTLELHSPLYFAHNSAVIDERSHPLLDEIARVLDAHPEVTVVVIEGHTDDSGTAAHNRRLSTARAAQIAIALVRRGVRPVRLRASGFGPERPLVPNDSEENRSKNRRVELHIEGRAH